jgi:hypothetical protein
MKSCIQQMEINLGEGAGVGTSENGTYNMSILCFYSFDIKEKNIILVEGGTGKT